MKILITGAAGMLGTALQQRLGCSSHEWKAYGRAQLDITRLQDVSAALMDFKPHFVINCAALTRVDVIESMEQEALAVNGRAAGELAFACSGIHAGIVHLSTDYVFDGVGRRGDDGFLRPYVEDDPTNPISVYGRSKLLGELDVAQANVRHCIVRSAWLYDAEHGFLKNILGQMHRGQTLRVVDDLIGTPTLVDHLADCLIRMIENDCRGTYHATAEGEGSWYQFALEAAHAFGIEADIQPCRDVELGKRARRPAYSVLENRRLKEETDIVFLPWIEALYRYADTLISS